MPLFPFRFYLWLSYLSLFVSDINIHHRSAHPFIIMHRSFPTWHEGMRYRTMYVCDRKKCDPCAKGCNYTSDIEHTLYDDHPEHTFVPGEYGYRYERVRKQPTPGVPLKKDPAPIKDPSPVKHIPGIVSESVSKIKSTLDETGLPRAGRSE